MKNILCLLGFLIAPFLLLANTPLEKAWEAFENKDRVAARKYLEEARKDAASEVDATMALILLNELEAQTGNLDLTKSIFDKWKNPSAYLYSIWFQEAVVAGYSKKDKAHEAFIKEILKSDQVNQSIKGGANYILGFHHNMSNDFKEAYKVWDQVNTLKDWQFVGPFDNSSGSGFDKNYKPISEPAPSAKFVSKTNSDVHWYTPAYPQLDPWMSTIFHFPSTEAIVYAQTFVNSPEEQEVILAVGHTGNIKVWINDQLAVEEEEELRTEMDIHKRIVRLTKGENRVLVQLGFTSKSGYPNFGVRFLDKNDQMIQNITHNSTYKSYNKATAASLGEEIPHFASTYFEEKVKKEPKNILNYILLGKVYARSSHYNDAIEILQKGIAIAPNNILLQYDLMLAYKEMDDRTKLLKQLEYVRTLDEDIPFFAAYDFGVNMDNEDYVKAEENLENLYKYLGEDHEDCMFYQIKILNAKEAYQKMILLVDKAYKKYPTNTDFLMMKFNLEKNRSASSLQGAQVLERYLKNNYNFRIRQQLIQEYTQLGNRSKVEKLYLEDLKNSPEESRCINNLSNFYYRAENYKKSLKYIEMGLKNVPFYSGYWSDKAYVLEAMGKEKEAIEAFKKAIHFNPNSFQARENVRRLEGKKTILSYFEKENAEALIKAAIKEENTTDDSFSYIFEESNYVIFPEGASIQHAQVAIKILNESGIEEWKEANIGSGRNQTLNVIQAEVIKKNGQKVKAERNYGQMVFPSLEVGDAIYIEYTMENYTGGKLSKEFWKTYVFNNFVPTQSATYRLLTPKDYPINIKTIHIDKEAKKSELDEFICYEWSFENLEKCKDESYMPNLSEVGMSLHLSTVDSWETIADWYSDLALPRAKEDYNLNQVYNSIFEGKDFKSKAEKAKAIYDYIGDNIRYSSLSFRQSNFVPQKPMVTISTQLGDCKDVSTLYHTLAKKAGLETHLVLVNTRDNGEKTMQLPSIDFNHCIIKIELDEGTLFQELTDSKLPFGAVPKTIANAQALVIPNSAEDTAGKELIHIPNAKIVANKIKRNIDIKIIDSEMSIHTNVTAGGRAASDYRHYFSGMPKEQTRKTVQKVLGSYFENNLKLDDYKFEKMEARNVDFVMEADFVVEDEAISIGGFNAVKIPFFEKLASLNAFADEEREHPFIYWAYENNDLYETEITLTLPEGAKEVEIPENASFKNDFVDYKLTIEKVNNQTIKLVRSMKIDTQNIPASSYDAFRDMVKKVLKAEDFYIAYK